MPQRPPFDRGPNGRGPGGPRGPQQPFQQRPNRQQRPPYGYREPVRMTSPNVRKIARGGRSVFSLIIVAFILLSLLGAVIQSILPLLLIGGLGAGAYYLVHRKSALQKANIKQRLQDLKEEVNRLDRQLKNLDNFHDNKDTLHYVPLAQDLLPQLQEVKKEATNLKEEMDLSIYKRIVNKVDTVSTDIRRELDLLQIPTEEKSKTEEDQRIASLAPEILQVYRNIQTDHFTILEKLKDRENKREMGALHEAEMGRFQDILDGYLQIKENPKNYYNAEERLEQAKLALEQFDKNLDETLRQLNESELSDFDISLRMMNNAEEDD